MPDSFVIFSYYGGLEWGNRYYVTAVASDIPGQADTIAQAQRELQADNVQLTRWELLDSLGHKTTEGGFSDLHGVLDGDMMPIHYALLIRFNTTGPKRPSYKYVHGYTEQLQTDGAPSSLLPTQLGLYSSGLEDADVGDSDGSVMTSITFRKFTRRKRMRHVDI